MAQNQRQQLHSAHPMLKYISQVYSLSPITSIVIQRNRTFSSDEQRE